MKRKGNYAFIDSQNLNLGIQKMGWKLDWRKFRSFLSKRYNVTQAYMFIGYLQENEALYEQMHDNGYLIVLKPTVETASVDTPEVGEESTDKKMVVKGNTDADMVLFIMKELSNYDKAIVVSGDGDFYSTIEYLAQHQKLGALLTPNWQYSTLLKEFESYVVRLDTMKRQLAYKQRHTAHSSVSGAQSKKGGDAKRAR